MDPGCVALPRFRENRQRYFWEPPINITVKNYQSSPK